MRKILKIILLLLVGYSTASAVECRIDTQDVDEVSGISVVATQFNEIFQDENKPKKVCVLYIENVKNIRSDILYISFFAFTEDIDQSTNMYLKKTGKRWIKIQKPVK